MRPSGSLLFKKGQQGLDVSFTQGLGRPDQSVVYYTATRLSANVPFPDDATDILFDDRRPYLSCFTAAPVEASLDFFRKALAASGWLPLSAADAAADWPNAGFDDKIANGARAYFSYANRDGGYRQPPIMLSLRHRDDGRTSVEIRVAPFALPQNLALARESAGLPVPDHTPSSGSSGDSDSVRRTAQGMSVADIPAVLAFYRSELAARGWKEEANGAVVTPDEVTLNFSSPDQTATLRLEPKIRPDHSQSRDANDPGRAGGAGQGQKGRRRQVHERRRRDGEKGDGRGCRQADRAGRRPVGRAAARARRPGNTGAVAGHAPRTCSSTAPTANSNSIPLPA